MKRNLILAIALFFGVLGAMAQGRDAYSFKTSFHFDEDSPELVDSITVDVLVDGVKTPLNFSQRVFTPREPADGYTKWIIERDINFDVDNKCKDVALQAFRLSFEHPVKRENISFEAPFPADYPWSLFA